ncbi:MAG: CDP-glycerol glycerophosphotransferase family protein [Chthoniobacter sp.]|nr:CDP-glycerol glycerophosphotransferase family protein [Chthoniobacter sp.]
MSETTAAAERASAGAAHRACRLGIALMGKGATNHLHRPGVVEALRARGIKISFLVRSDYAALLARLPGAEYRACSVDLGDGWLARLRNFARYFRSLYPAREVGARMRYRVAASSGFLPRALYAIGKLVARSRNSMRALLAVESLFYRDVHVTGVEPRDLDRLLLLGTGTYGTESEGALTWWARRHGVPVLHCVGNYDSLSSKGFRGVPVERLLAWGSAMRQDAISLHAIPPERVVSIGAIRYDRLQSECEPDKAKFLRGCGLDPAKPVILFAGSTFEFHYFEILEILRLLHAQGRDCQLILRVYPNKTLMASPFIPALIAHARSLAGVHVSVGDPDFASGAAHLEVLQIEETELGNSLAWCDLVINLYSTIALEGCIFDKPVINMWYFGRHDQRTLRPAIVVDYPSYRHVRRMAAYGAVSVAESRTDLQRLIVESLAHPEAQRAARARAVEQECGVLDGHACDRLAEECLNFRP